ncbi:Arsenical pump-driving ATPase [Escherichia coli]|nr:Arsenical pump-driving ATPase [Escherichia coli]
MKFLENIPSYLFFTGKGGVGKNFDFLRNGYTSG